MNRARLPNMSLQELRTLLRRQERLRTRWRETWDSTASQAWRGRKDHVWSDVPKLGHDAWARYMDVDEDVRAILNELANRHRSPPAAQE